MMEGPRWKSGESAAPLPAKHNRAGRALLPAPARQIGHVILGLGKSKTQISDELPVRGDIEDGCDHRRLEDRYPTHADALGARREPNRVHGGYRRILDHLRHGLTPQPMSLRGRTIGEHRQVTGRIVQPGKLESGIGGGSFGALRGQGVAVAAFEIFPNGCATAGIVDNHEAPGLTQADRRRQARQMDQALQCAGRQRIAPKASNIPPPHEQVAQPRAEAVVEARWLACVRSETLHLRHAPFLKSVTASSRLSTSTRRRDEHNSDLAYLLQRAQDIAGLAADLPYA